MEKIALVGILALIGDKFLSLFLDQKFKRFRWPDFTSERNTFLLYFFLSILIYGIALSHFDFWSDDFGYFLNFSHQTSSSANIISIFTSYLTGGVPRLQLGWHITHQLLFLIFRTSVWGYFAVQVAILVINSLLLNKILRPIIGQKASFWTGIFLIVTPFYKESFYWVSANYGFFQLLFFLISYLTLNRAFTSKTRLAKATYLFLSSISIAWSVLYQEQAIFFIVGAPLIFFLFNLKKYPRKQLIKYVSSYFLLTFFIIASLFVTQFFIIKSSSPTSLVDTFKVYYPTPLLSAKNNMIRIIRETFFAFKPRLDDYTSFKNDLAHVDLELILKFKLSASLLLLTFFGTVVALRNQLNEKKITIGKHMLLGLCIWFLVSAIIVIPINIYASRYVYIMLPAALALAIYAIVRFFPRFHILLLAGFAVLCVFDHLAFYYGSFFPLTNIQMRTFQKVNQYVKRHPNVKAVVLSSFPTSLHNAVTGAWINYHAAEWWYAWKMLPNETDKKVFGNSFYPAVDENGKSGFRIIYGDYPPERLRKVFSPEELVQASFVNTSPYVKDPKLKFNQRKSIRRKLSNGQIVINNTNPFKEFVFGESKLDIKDCYVDIVAHVNTNTNTVGSIWFYSDEGEGRIEGTAHSSGLENEETIFLRTLVKGGGPYRIKLTYQNAPYEQKNNNPSVVFRDVQVLGCGSNYQSDSFVRTNNPDPKNPMIRWTSPQMNYSVTLPYPHAPVWERGYSIGVNDAINSGDYYCFPDDLLSVRNKQATLLTKSYLGMLGWTRSIMQNRGALSVTFSRNPQSGIAQRGTLDIMSEKEFYSYEKDNPPVSIAIKHDFDVNKNYFPIEISLTSLSDERLTARYVFSDSPVMDFRIGSNRGMSSIILSNGLTDQYYYSTNKKNQQDIPIIYRKQTPYNNNLAAFNYSCDPTMNGHFLGGFDDDVASNISTRIPTNVFENDIIKKANREDKEFLLKTYIKDASVDRYILKGGQELSRNERNRLSKIFNSIGFYYPQNHLELIGTFNQDDELHGQHGLWFDIELDPHETKAVKYFQVILQSWMNEKDMIEDAQKTLSNINKEFCDE